MLGLAALSELLALWLIVRMWWRFRPGAKRGSFWTLVLLVPVIGPLFYGGSYGGAPERHGEHSGPSMLGTGMGSGL